MGLFGGPRVCTIACMQLYVRGAFPLFSSITLQRHDKRHKAVFSELNRESVQTCSAQVLPVYIIKSVRDFVDDFDSMLFGQRGDGFVPTQTVGFCVVLVGQPRCFPLVEQHGKHILWLPSHDKQPEQVQRTIT